MMLELVVLCILLVCLFEIIGIATVISFFFSKQKPKQECERCKMWHDSMKKEVIRRIKAEDLLDEAKKISRYYDFQKWRVKAFQ